jgi:prevent-host-death family protein
MENLILRSYPLHEARAEFSKLGDRALSGEPQRITRHGREAVMIVSEAEWAKRSRSANLGDLLATFAERTGFDEDLLTQPLTRQDRPPGSDFLADGE